MQARYRSHQWSGQRDLNGSIMNMTQWQYLMERTPGWPAVPDNMHRAPNPSPHSLDTHFPLSSMRVYGGTAGNAPPIRVISPTPEPLVQDPDPDGSGAG